MFGSGADDRNVIPVNVTLSSGKTVQGHVFGGMTGKLADILNKDEPFLEFAKPSGEVILIAKSSIAAVAPVKVARTDQLSRRMRETGIPDPHQVLGLQRGANQMEVQNAYHSLARRYHPDHFSGREIPDEVLQYVSAMFQRITAAYNELKGGTQSSDAA